MKFTYLPLIAAILSTTLIPVHSMADAKKGKRIYKKRMYKKCGFSGVKFARHHTQAEWETLYEKRKFQAEALKICPKIDTAKIKPKNWNDLYDFSVKYAKDGVAPNGCND